MLHALGPDDFVLEPLPNHLYTRDASAWIGTGVSINSMRKLARVRETANYEAIYRWHPLFADAGFPVWSAGSDERRRDHRGRRHPRASATVRCWSG